MCCRLGWAMHTCGSRCGSDQSGPPAVHGGVVVWQQGLSRQQQAAESRRPRGAGGACRRCPHATCGCTVRAGPRTGQLRLTLSVK